MEIWKDIEGYEGLYQVSNLGRVKSLNYLRTGKEKILSQSKNPNGYLKVNLYKNGKKGNWYVHRLVAEAFIPNPQNFPEVNHKSENKEMNTVDDLEWTTHSLNVKYGTGMKRAHRFKRSFKSKPVICLETGVEYPSTLSASKYTGVVQSNISECCSGKHKTAGGFHWKYAKSN